MFLYNIPIWLENNILSLLAMLVSIFALWHTSIRERNRFKVILFREEAEDFFILQNDGNKDQILLDYNYCMRDQPRGECIIMLSHHRAEKIIVKPGEKHILQPRIPLMEFIKSQTKTHSVSTGPFTITQINDKDAKEQSFIVGMAFTYVSPKGKVKMKVFNYAIYTPDNIITRSHKWLDDKFIFLNR